MKGLWFKNMAIKIISATHSGLDGVLINVEVDITKGIPIFNIIVYIIKIFKSLAMTIILKSIGNTVKPIIK